MLDYVIQYERTATKPKNYSVKTITTNLIVHTQKKAKTIFVLKGLKANLQKCLPQIPQQNILISLKQQNQIQHILHYINALVGRLVKRGLILM